MIERGKLADGSIRLSGDGCSYAFVTLAPGVFFMAIAGRETGTLGRAAIGEVAVEASLHPPLRLFIDMSDLKHVADCVSDDWTAWFQANRAAIRRIDVLAPDVFVRLVVAVSQVFSRTGDLIALHTDPSAFDAVLQSAAPHFQRNHQPAQDAAT